MKLNRKKWKNKIKIRENKDGIPDNNVEEVIDDLINYFEKIIKIRNNERKSYEKIMMSILKRNLK